MPITSGDIIWRASTPISSALLPRKVRREKAYAAGAATSIAPTPPATESLSELIRNTENCAEYSTSV
jgi:hypothetical protein